MKKDLKEFFKTYRDRGAGKLFPETIQASDMPFEPIFNLGEDDTEDTWSLKKLYLKYYNDPHEILFVDEVLGGRFDLWKTMTEHKVLSKFIQTLREEARARFLADNFKMIKTIADVSEPKTAIAALKFLCTSIGGKPAEEGAGRGRPSKKEIQQRTNEILSEDKEIQEAFARVQGLN